MATASVDRGILWTDVEGRELPGGWRLRRLLRPEGRTAWFEATGPDGKQAMVSLTEALNDEEELMARLRAAATIRHPNVVAIREAQLARVDETPMVMAAMEATDENLAEVLRERALEAAEARLLMDALLQGLAAIHARRLVHGRMQAGSVLAMGDTVKLRSDCVHADGFAAGAGEDVRGLGRIVTQALTRRIPANENDAVLLQLGEPLGRAVRRALSGNATVEEVAALAGIRIAAAARGSSAGTDRAVTATPIAVEKAKKAEASREAEQAGAVVEKPMAKVMAMPPVETTAAATPASEKTTAQMDLPLIPRWKADPEAEDEDEDWSGRLQGVLASVRDRFVAGRWQYHRRSALWVIGAAAVLVVATALMLHGWLHGSAAKAVAVSPRVVVEHAAPAAQAPAVAAAAGPRVWRVVVYTYHDRKEAQRQAHAMAAKYPQLRPGVMATRSGDSLVTVGGAMSREQAVAFRARAVRMGLPRDSYAQNFR